MKDATWHEKLGKETVLWGTKDGWEHLITSDPAKIEAATKWAQDNGFTNIRVSVIDLTTPPDFASTLNV